jgi:hypothetical protein
MTTLAQLRKTALSNQETAEQEKRSGTVAFAVRGKQFAAGKDGQVHLHLPPGDVDRILAEFPTAGRLTRGAAQIGVRIPLADINGQQLNHWVRRAWLSRAPKQLAAQATAADTASAGDAGGLPKAIGRPATQALISIGITSLDQVAELTEAELAAMHGVGPKAIRVLAEALHTSGRRFKD